MPCFKVTFATGFKSVRCVVKTLSALPNQRVSPIRSNNVKQCCPAGNNRVSLQNTPIDLQSLTLIDLSFAHFVGAAMLVDRARRSHLDA